MTTKTKVLLSVFIPLLGLLVGGGLTFWLVYPELSAQYVNVAWEWLNEPLPVVGVSAIIVGGIIIKIISMTSWGKAQVSKVNEIVASFQESTSEVLDQQRALMENQVKRLEAEGKEKDKKIEQLKNQVITITKLLPNKKVKELGKEMQDEKAINSDPKKE